MLTLEIKARWNGKYPVSGWRYDKDLLWTMKKNYYESYDSLIKTVNEDGFRGKNVRYQKTKGTKRIMILGDSYTVGYDFSDEQIFTSLLEKKLNSNNHEHYEIINIAVPAWATDQEYIYLKKFGIKYKPDYVILMASPNDIRESFCKKIFEIVDSNLSSEEPKYIKLPFEEIFYWGLANHSSFFQYLQKKKYFTDYGDFLRLQRYYKIHYGKMDSSNWDIPIFLRSLFQEVKESKWLFKKLIFANE